MYQLRLTQKTMGDNEEDIKQDLRESEELGRAANCLRQHGIPKKLRAKMVNWMVEVLSILGSEEQTFFKAVGVMDLYYANNRRYRTLSVVVAVLTTTSTSRASPPCCWHPS